MAEALPAMVLAAGSAIGRKSESPVMVDVDDVRKGRVELGELESHGVVEESVSRRPDPDTEK